MPIDEKDVAGENRAILGNVGEHVAARMRRPDLDQAHRLVADAETQLAFEGAGRHRDIYPRELERRENTREELAGRAKRRGVGLHLGQSRRTAVLAHLFGARP